MLRLLFLISLVFVLTPTGFAHADVIETLVKIDCNKDLNYLQVSTLPLTTDNGINKALSLKKDLYDKHGLILASQLIDYPNDFAVAKTVEKICTLKNNSKTVTYGISIKGLPGNANPQGQCGGWSSFEISVDRDKTKIIDNIPFEKSCNSSSKLFHVMIQPENAYIDIQGIGLSETAWFENSLPITYETLYQPEN